MTMTGEIVPAGRNGPVPLDVLPEGRAVQQIRTSYATAVAVQKPRQLQDVQRRLLQEAVLAGEDFYYGWGANKDRIEGPSVNLALCAARCYGNCAVETLPVQDLADSWVFTAAFIDLETGFTLLRQFRQSKQSKVGGKMDNERKDDIRFQIGQSKAIRNVILNALSPSLVRNAMDEAKKGVRQKIEAFTKQKGLPAAVDLVVKALAKCAVREAAILAKCGVADRKAITIDHLVILRGDLQAIESGQDRAETLFPEAPAGNPPAPQHEAEAGEKPEKKPRKAKGRQAEPPVVPDIPDPENLADFDAWVSRLDGLTVEHGWADERALTADLEDWSREELGCSPLQWTPEQLADGVKHVKAAFRSFKERAEARAHEQQQPQE